VPTPFSADEAPGLADTLFAPLPASVTLDPKKVALGERLFPDPRLSGDGRVSCVSCHDLNKGGANGTGPNLWGVAGAAIGKHAAGFPYSPALAGKGGNWDWENLNHWIKSPREFAPGTKMTFAGIGKGEDRANLLAWLNTQSDSPMPLPTPQAAAPAGDPKAAAEKADQPAGAPGKAEDEPVMNEQQATPNRVGGDAAPSVAGRAGQEKH
jgi:cytochrome c